jgi:thiamine biosynthesis lipoprotein
MIEFAMIPGLAPAIEAPFAGAGAWQFRDEAVLGTRMNLMVKAEQPEQALIAAQLARSEIDRLNRVFNSRSKESELAGLNASREWLASADLYAAIAATEQWRAATDGAFSPRLGRVLDLWRGAGAGVPDAARVLRAAESAANAHVEMDAETRTIVRPAGVKFALDGFAKGWIVDAALKAMLCAPGVRGGLVDIGGDIASAGEAPDGGWTVGIPDPLLPYDNAPLVDGISLTDGGIATSGRGPRDRIVDGKRLSPTLAPRTGWSVETNVSATVIARSAADADALATAVLVLPPDVSSEIIRQREGVSARVTAPDGGATILGNWPGRDMPAPVQVKAPGLWPEGWQALATFTAPRRQLIRDPDFRSPYMAMWITDESNNPVRTLILIGRKAEWQRDNYIWWQQNRDATGKLMATRSMSTSGSGVYNVFWDGVDDRGRPVKAGNYVLHVETSREKGKHTYRRLALDFSEAKRFAQELAATEEGGGLKVTYDHY